MLSTFTLSSLIQSSLFMDVPNYVPFRSIYGFCVTLCPSTYSYSPCSPSIEFYTRMYTYTPMCTGIQWYQKEGPPYECILCFICDPSFCTGIFPWLPFYPWCTFTSFPLDGCKISWRDISLICRFLYVPFPFRYYGGYSRLYNNYNNDGFYGGGGYGMSYGGYRPWSRWI